MEGQTERGAGGAGPFDALDAKLNIYALANGMDLVRGPGSRRLEWHRDRLERGILLEATGESTLDVTAAAWAYGDPASARKQEVERSMSAEAAARALSALLQRALDAANAL